ncbi:DNA-directed RNA polymerase subunit omega [Paracoccus sp. J55]|uniref:DNA-directed RNA polymerase subunit omega n=1 Tax=Paracoccus sp. J55 TaxID=935849 RepID=UPI000A02322A|nr:DNA-directed RNA polymerase subunit omega [Paracoccus sp. J55]
MNPLLPVDCQAAMPDRFGLVLAAAARTRALREGAAPRLGDASNSATETALAEIAAGAFAPEELSPFLPPSEPRRLAKPN